MSSSLKGIRLTLKQAMAEIARCHARLEIDRAYRYKGNRLVRFQIPYKDRARWPDGIMCRDDTIRLLDKQIKEMKDERRTNRTGLRTNKRGKAKRR